jgi:predicted  nucleic acid-binding Zn-ribbon protein
MDQAQRSIEKMAEHITGLKERLGAANQENADLKNEIYVLRTTLRSIAAKITEALKEQTT